MVHYLLGANDMHDSVDQGEMGECLREVAEVAAAEWVNLLRIKLERACVCKQPFT